uniref:Fibronectin type-III domain-containing protein n=1 Tax=Neogobius melanostomus TaxID=47308 RepID=A0A8C6WVK4_9GOBI
MVKLKKTWLRLKSVDFKHVLQWERGAGTSPEVTYSVGPCCTVVPGCERLQELLLCDLTDACSNPEETYHLRVTALHHSEQSLSFWNNFYPIRDTELQPPVLRVAPCKPSLCVDLDSPVPHLRSFYENYNYELKVERLLPVRSLERKKVHGVAEGSQFCVSIRFADKIVDRQSNFSQAQCVPVSSPAHTAAGEGIDSAHTGERTDSALTGEEQTPPTQVQVREQTPPTQLQVREQTPPTQLQVRNRLRPHSCGEEQTPPTAAGRPPQLQVNRLATQCSEEETPPTQLQVREQTPPTQLQVREQTPPTQLQVREETPPTQLQVREQTPPTQLQVREQTPPTQLQVKEQTPPTQLQVREKTLPTRVGEHSQQCSFPPLKYFVIGLVKVLFCRQK